MDSPTTKLALLALSLALIQLCSAQLVSNVRATSHPYNPEQHNWDMKETNVYCATWHAGKPLEWRKKYAWTAFCHPMGPQGEASCGRCLRVTNLGSGAQMIVRVVDKCNNGGLDLDVAPFNQLDENGNGKQYGYLTVAYEFIDCQD